jgi:hypothetical protein
MQSTIDTGKIPYLEPVSVVREDGHRSLAPEQAGRRYSECPEGPQIFGSRLQGLGGVRGDSCQ